MNVAFFHDSIFIKKENTYYTSGTLNDELFQFYLEFFKEITVVTRYVPFDPSKKKYINSTNKISLDQVNFHLVPSYQKARKIVKEEMKKCDVAIIRCHSFIGTIAAYYAKKYKKKYIF